LEQLAVKILVPLQVVLVVMPMAGTHQVMLAVLALLDR